VSSSRLSPQHRPLYRANYRAQEDPDDAEVAEEMKEGENITLLAAHFNNLMMHSPDVGLSEDSGQDDLEQDLEYFNQDHEQEINHRWRFVGMAGQEMEHQILHMPRVVRDNDSCQAEDEEFVTLKELNLIVRKNF
jgi:hypothetical protein